MAHPNTQSKSAQLIKAALQKEAACQAPCEAELATYLPARCTRPAPEAVHTLVPARASRIRELGLREARK
eukprot:14716444-Alexandrium_andersonii.AAC.2